eukprot:72448_1
MANQFKTLYIAMVIVITFLSITINTQTTANPTTSSPTTASPTTTAPTTAAPSIATNVSSPTTSPITSQPTLSPIAIDCDPEKTCDGHGDCTYSGSGDELIFASCKCDNGFTTYPDPPTGDQPYCNYPQKSQLTAFLLSWFLGAFGAGRFYVGDYVLGAIKLCLIFMGCFLGCICMVLANMCGGGGEQIGLVPICLAATALSAWCIADIILFAMNDIPD